MKIDIVKKNMQDLKTRTKRFALDCWRVCKNIPKTREYDSWVRQLIRSSSSVGANYRASQRGKSAADFINKLKIVEEEVDESLFWLELLSEGWNPNDKKIKRLITEANELLAITVSSINTAKRRLR